MSTEAGLLAAIVADPESDVLRLVYADWLEENGQAARAKFIRARLVLDGGRPEFGAYADALEALRDCGYVPGAADTPMWGGRRDDPREDWWYSVFGAMQLDEALALVRRPEGRGMVRLVVAFGLVYDEAGTLAVGELADAPLDSLRRFDFYGSPALPAAAGERLFAAPWLARLEWLLLQSPPAAFAPLRLPGLHTLCVWAPRPAGWVEAFGRDAELPALRRLVLRSADLKGARTRALAGLRAGELVELWLSGGCKLGRGNLAKLLAAPWARRLEVLTLDGTVPDDQPLDLLAAAPCAKRLRVLRLWYTGPARFGGSALTTPGAFPLLTSLELNRAGEHYTDAPGTTADTAEFLRALHAPGLRYLRLAECGSAEVLRPAFDANPTLAGCKLVTA